MPTPSDRRTFEMWRQISQTVHRLRHTARPTASNELLQGNVDAHQDEPLAGLLLLWLGDNFLLESRFDAGVQIYQDIISRYPDRRFGSQTLLGLALQQAATCHEAMGRFEQAADCFKQIVQAGTGDTSPAWCYREIGRLAEAAGRREEATQAYRQAAEAIDVPSRTMANIPDLARRDAERLTRGPDWVRAPEQLARELADALRRGDGDHLERLASPTHFTIGLSGGERQFVEPGPLLRELRSDLADSDVAVDAAAIRGAGGKLYLETHGWNGSFFSGSVLLIMARAPGGYEWGGIGLTQLPHRNGDRPDRPDLPHDDPPVLPPDPPPGEGSTPTSPPVTPASLMMKAPWPAGQNFRAGGIVGFSAEIAGFYAIAAPFGPFAPFIYAGLVETASLATPCGFGPGGLYYGQPTTHVGRDTFAVDFSRFVQGVPLFLDARGKAVLAVADGIVSFVRGSTVTGDPAIDNQVVIGHITEIEIFIEFLNQLFGGQPTLPKYSTEYLHLDGPGLVPVSTGMFVKQGARLGLVDDTGLSVADHLHFSLHDRDLPGSSDSVRPTPIDGQSLEDWDDGRCLSSTNVPIP
ncbi:tetratricopeptide repeat protein [Actinoplanes sp. NPDC051513]|uniref:tetratricopeptide repeat protein n=1 Tax=Actinoplanes sp. NPDC051513 TaxID=3363908 RepID=UPI0037B46077